MSFSDENRPALANVYRDNGENKGMKTNEPVKKSQVKNVERDDVVKGAPKPVPTAGKKEERDYSNKKRERESERERENGKGGNEEREG